jgi:hypothetical protein
LDGAFAAHNADPDSDDWTKIATVWMVQYNCSMFIRGDNSLENAKYLGYLDARELYPDFKPRKFEACVKEAIAGEAPSTYGETNIVAKHTGENARRV